MINFGNSVQEFYLRTVKKNYKDRKQKLAALKTKQDALDYVADVRAKVKKIFKFPAEKCPLNVRVKNELSFPGVKMKNLLFNSRENFSVSASLIYPEQKAEKYPAILFVCGHSDNGRLRDIYQTAARQLAARGFIVLSLDPIGQGERHQYPEIRPIGSCQEHNILGKQLLLTGDWFGNWRTYDGIRGIDLLLSLPEVDPSRIGIMGTSGGGTMTTLISAADDRLAFSAPSCYITTWLRNVENELPADIEQMVPGAIGMGMEMVDLLVAGAPRPRLILGEKNDFFDARGTKEAYEELKALYKLLGCEDDVELFIGPGSHSLSKPLREAAYDFFCRKAGIPNFSKTETDPGRIVDQELYAADGWVVKVPGEKRVHDIIVETAAAQKAARRKYSKDEICAILKEKLGITMPEVPDYRVLRVMVMDEATCNWVSRFGLETEKDLVMSVLHRRSKNLIYHIEDAKSINLYIPHLDTNKELGMRQDSADRFLYGLDYRGVGECRPTTCSPWCDFFAQYEYDFHFTCLGEMTGLSYLGGRVKDILAAVELLSLNCQDIHLEARGQGGIPALIAAILSDKIKTVKLVDVPESWESMILPAIPDPSRSARACMIDGIMEHFDLADIKEHVTIVQ
ncbi:MAG: acetylxylan esterase [Lentisphaerae bacterium]|nr:acetylxylan esterase [Lentisphaerota bacterium]